MILIISWIPTFEVGVRSRYLKIFRLSDVINKCWTYSINNFIRQVSSSIQPPIGISSPDPVGDLLVVDDDDDSSDEDGPVLKDGTINASERNPKPLREFLPHRTSVVAAPPPPTGNGATPSSSANEQQQHRISGMPLPPSKGPSRPLPPTPDDNNDDSNMSRGVYFTLIFPVKILKGFLQIVSNKVLSDLTNYQIIFMHHLKGW